MTYRTEFEPQATLSGEDSALRPTRGGDAQPLIHHMLDDYLEVEKIFKKVDDKAEPARAETLGAYLHERRTSIVDYAELSIEEGALPTDPRLEKKAEGVPLQYAELYVSRELRRTRFDRAKTLAANVLKQMMSGKLLTEHPGHITIEPGAELESDATIAFIDVVKGGFKMSAKALRQIKEAPLIHSEEITLPVTAVLKDDRYLLDDPRYRDDMTQTIHTVKPR